MNVNADIGLSFHIEPSLAPKLYGRFRLNDLEKLSDGYMRNTVREAFNDVASKLPVQDIYGAGKSKMLGDVTQKCRDVFGKDGIVIDQLTINGTLRLPQNVSTPSTARWRPRRTPSRAATASRRSQAEADAGHHAGARRGRGGAAEGAGRGRRPPHPRARRGAGQRDHPPVDDAGGPAVPRARALGRQAPRVQRGRSCRCSRSTSSKGGAAIDEPTRQKRSRSCSSRRSPRASAPPSRPPPP